MNNNEKLTEEKQFKESAPLIQQPTSKKPDDLSGLNIEARFKISNPESGKVIIEGRA